MTRRRQGSLAASMAVVLAASTAGAQPRRNPRPTAAAVELVDVPVRAGETCAAIARRVFRNPARTDVIHQYNPTVCPAQRRLVAGMVLRLPRRLPPQRGPVPVAFLTVVNNSVEVQTLPTAQPRPGQANDSLFRGTRVSTEARSSAELSFSDDTQLRLYESTLVVILGDTSTRVRRTATARDTTLVSGSLRAFLGTLANGPTATPTPPVVAAPVPGRPARAPRRAPPRRPTQVAINTAGGRATLRDGESQLTIETGARASTTLTVYRGSGQLRSGAQTVTVPEGFGARAAVGERIAPVHRLPLAPRWIERPARLLLAEGDRAIEGRYAAGEPGTPPGAPEPAEWRVQIARDAAFTAIAADARVPVAVDRLAVPAVPAGNYFVRVSAFDAEHFEGPFSDVVPVSVVVPRLADTDRPYQQTLVLPADVRCALDGVAVDTTASTLVDRLREHTLRCGAESVGEDAVQTTFAAIRRSPFRVTATLDAPDAHARSGQVRLRVVDQRDVPYAEGGLRVEARGGAAPEGARAGASAGDWVVPVRWNAGATSLSLRLTPDGGEAVDTEALSLPAPPVVTPTEGIAQRVSVRGEGLYANMLSEYQRNANASAYMGNVKAITHGIAGSLRIGFDLRRPTPGEAGVVLGLEVMSGGVLFPRDGGDPGVATLVGGGLRLTVRNGTVQPWASAAGAVVFTGGLLRFGVDAGLGVDFRVSRAVAIGPVVRYVHVLELNDDPLTASLDEDARLLQVGLGLTLRFPPSR